MTRRYFILEEADREIDAQVLFYAEHAGAVIAERFYAPLQCAFASLLANPGHGRAFESKHPALGGLRVWLVHGFPFLVYYREVAGGIEIVHVLHGARDRDRILGKEWGRHRQAGSRLRREPRADNVATARETLPRDPVRRPTRAKGCLECGGRIPLTKTCPTPLAASS
jgi:toxin ParE1/3/4